MIEPLYRIETLWWKCLKKRPSLFCIACSGHCIQRKKHVFLQKLGCHGIPRGICRLVVPVCTLPQQPPPLLLGREPRRRWLKEMKDVTNVTGGALILLWCAGCLFPKDYGRTASSLSLDLGFLDGTLVHYLVEVEVHNPWFLILKFLNRMCRHSRKDVSFLITMIPFFIGENRSEKWEKLGVFSMCDFIG